MKNISNSFHPIVRFPICLLAILMLTMGLNIKKTNAQIFFVKKTEFSNTKIIWNNISYQIGPKLGEGVYGVVYALDPLIEIIKQSENAEKSANGESNSSSPYIIKLLKGGGAFTHFNQEEALHSLLKLAGIPTVNTFWDKKSRFIIKDRVNGESLDSFLEQEKNSKENIITRKIKIDQLLTFIQKLVDSKIFFGDLHGENIHYDSEKGWLVVDARLPKRSQGEFLTTKTSTIKAYKKFFKFLYPQSTIIKKIFQILKIKNDSYGINMDVEGHLREFEITNNCPPSYLEKEDQLTPDIASILEILKNK